MVKKFYNKRSFQKKPAGPLVIDSLRTSDKLIIVESPSKCKKIESFLGSQWTCIASKGHIRTIDGLANIDTGYNVTYSMLPDKTDHVDWMRTIISKFDKSKIYLATDDDREGEAIAWHICDVFDLSIETTARVLFHEITEPAVKTAVENPTLLDMNKVRSQMSRQVLDILVGFRISPLLWKYLYRNRENSLSAGRCQTPALRLVYENEMESKAAVIETKYRIRGSFYAKKIVFDLSKQLDKSSDVLDFLEKSKTFSHEMTMGAKKESIQNAPKPFSTSSLLQSASSVLNMSPKETMSLCQELYQEGHITYMRTESQTYSAVFLKEAESYIREEYSEVLGENLRCADESNPHEAIRVTHIESNTVDISNGRAATLYKWIWRNTVASCMSGYRAYITPIHISAPDDLMYQHIIETPISLGWKKVDQKMSDGRCEKEVLKDQISGSALLLYIQSSPTTNVKYNEIGATISVHGRHSHYTEASLIHRLEVLGIGRPSTFASIINTIIDRGYVAKTDIEGTIVKSTEYVLSSNGIIKENTIDKVIGQEKAKLRIQPIGIMVSDFLEEHFSKFFAYDYTKIMEENLDQIAVGADIPLCKLCDRDIAESISNMTNINKPTFALCDSTEYRVVFERYGPVLRKVLDDGSYHYESTQSGIDIDKLKSGEYTLEEVLKKPEDRVIGQHEDIPIILKVGPYGRYIEYNDEKTSIDSTATDEEVLKAFLEKVSDKKEANMIRELTPDISIRNGRYGAYIFYKTPKMKKPKFFNLNDFKESYRLCSQETLLKWIKEKHNIP